MSQPQQQQQTVTDTAASGGERKCAKCGRSSADLKACGGCGKVVYCTRECQRAHWPTHKTSCLKKHKRDGDDVEVQWEDQQRINLFGRLNYRFVYLTQLTAQKKQELDNLKDAISELELSLEEDAAKLLIGEVFVDADNEFAQEFLQREVSKIEQELEQVRQEAASVEERMKSLKVQLYAKFGNSINLDE